MRNPILLSLAALSVAVSIQALAADETQSNAATAATCAPVGPCGDVDESGSVTATDALRTLRAAVGLPETLACQCSGTASCPTASVLQTGISTCIDFYSIDEQTVNCAGTGQDGEIRAGVARGFRDNGDGTITDEKTGLMWEKNSDDGSIHDQDNTYTWVEAFKTKVALLNESSFAGHSDWRVPNRNELDSLVDWAAVNPTSAIYSIFDSNCSPGCTVFTCSCTNPHYDYWSSSPAAYTSSIWLMAFDIGAWESTGKQSAVAVRAVRGGT
jgi:hypothetical protein